MQSSPLIELDFVHDQIRYEIIAPLVVFDKKWMVFDIDERKEQGRNRKALPECMHVTIGLRRLCRLRPNSMDSQEPFVIFNGTFATPGPDQIQVFRFVWNKVPSVKVISHPAAF